MNSMIFSRVITPKVTRSASTAAVPRVPRYRRSHGWFRPCTYFLEIAEKVLLSQIVALANAVLALDHCSFGSPVNLDLKDGRRHLVQRTLQALVVVAGFLDERAPGSVLHEAVLLLEGTHAGLLLRFADTVRESSVEAHRGECLLDGNVVGLQALQLIRLRLGARPACLSAWGVPGVEWGVSSMVKPFHFSHGSGSMYEPYPVPFSRTPKCRYPPMTLPDAPVTPICWLSFTRWPGFTKILDRCP